MSTLLQIVKYIATNKQIQVINSLNDFIHIHMLGIIINEYYTATIPLVYTNIHFPFLQALP